MANRKAFIFLLAILFSSLVLQGQKFEYGLFAGASTLSPSSEQIKLTTEDGIAVSLQSANYGFHLGMYTKFQIFGLFLQPGVSLNSSRTDYLYEDLNNPEIAGTLIKETFYSADVPLLFGIKKGPFMGNTGPVAHYHISSSSTFDEMPNFETDQDKLEYSWRSGLAVQFWKLRLELMYQNSLRFLGDHIQYQGKTLTLSKRDNRVITNIYYKF